MWDYIQIWSPAGSYTLSVNFLFKRPAHLSRCDATGQAQRYSYLSASMGSSSDALRAG